jgi:phosphohistidine phosphatase
MAMLELYLIRHGVAEERGKDWPDDSKRPLTPDGIARLRRAARGLNKIDVGFDQIVTSPLVRTRQTADVFSEELKSKPPIVTSDSLAPAGAPPAVIQEVT